MELNFNLYKSGGEGATGIGPARRRWWRALGSGKAHAQVAALAARRTLKALRQALGGGRTHAEVAALAARRQWRSAHMD